MRDNPWIIRTYLKAQLIESNSRRVDEIELSERTIVGVNKFVETEASPLPTGEGSVITIPPEVEQNQIANLQAWRAARDQAAVDWPRRPFQRRRSGRGACPRRRHGRGLRGHPLHPGRNRQGRARQKRSCGGPAIPCGSHMPLVKEVVTKMREAGLDDVPVVVSGIIPPDDEAVLKEAGVAAVYTPKDFELNRIMTHILRIVEDKVPSQAA